MDIGKIIQTGNREELGKHFLSKGIKFTEKREYGKAYEFFLQGLDLVTCDCGTWRSEHWIESPSFFDDTEIDNNNPIEYRFVKAFVLFNLITTKTGHSTMYLYVALDAINSYLWARKDQYGLYVQSRIYRELDDIESATAACLQALSLEQSNARLNYRFARITEKHSNRVLDSFMENPSSPCCIRILKTRLPSDAVLEADDFEWNNNELVYAFQYEADPWKFQALYEKYLDIAPLENSDKSRKLEIFIDVIRKNEIIFHHDNDDDDNDDDIDWYDEGDDWEPDFDPDNPFGVSPEEAETIYWNTH